MSDPFIPYSWRRHADPVSGADALVTDALTVSYPGAERPAVEKVSLRIARGMRVALVGHNGAGKSSLLKAVAGLLPAQSGSIRIYGNPVGACHHRTAYLPQRGEIDWGFPLTVERLVMSGRYVHLGWFRWPGKIDVRIAEEVMTRLGLGDLAGKQIGELSGGQQQRALVARALAQQSDLLLLDEPLNAVDAGTRQVVSDVLGELQQQGKTVVVATHDLGSLARDFDAAVYLSQGRRIEREEAAAKEETWVS